MQSEFQGSQDCTDKPSQNHPASKERETDRQTQKLSLGSKQNTVQMVLVNWSLAYIKIRILTLVPPMAQVSYHVNNFTQGVYTKIQPTGTARRL